MLLLAVGCLFVAWALFGRLLTAPPHRGASWKLVASLALLCVGLGILKGLGL